MRNPKSRRAKLRTEPVNKRQRVDIAPVDSKDDFFQVKSFTAVVESSFKSFCTECVICGHSLDSICAIHLKNEEDKRNICEIIIGNCRHGFHHCCIARYLVYAGEKSLDECLKCEAAWKLKEKVPVCCSSILTL